MDNRRWVGPVPETAHRVIISRSGGYLRRINGATTFVDTTSALVIRPGDELSVAHPLGPGDTFTAIVLDAQEAARLDADGYEIAPGELTVDDRLDLTHRGLVTACRRGIDDLEAAERLHRIFAALPAKPGGRVANERRRPATVLAHRGLVNEIREALLERGYAAGLDEIAAAVNTSPHHLSRVFVEVTGESITAYRNRLRVRAVLTDLQDGADNLRVLAARYGFADQAHLTRVVRRQLGATPSAMRRLLEPRTNVQRHGGRSGRP